MEKVLVTGASGYIALHCIVELLNNGYSVKGSLRSPDRESQVRTAVAKNNKFYVQAGAGIVADSKPDKEYAETINKAKALMRAVD